MITVLFATYNGAKFLPSMLDAFTELQQPEGGFKVLAVDNNSTDATREILDDYSRKLPLQTLHCAARGKNRALNVGLSEVEGDLVILTDDDIIPSSDWIIEMQAGAAKYPAFDIFGAVIEPHWPSPPPDWLLAHVPRNVCFGLTSPDQPEGPIEPQKVHGANMMVRAKIFKGGERFDESVGPTAGEYAMGSETEFTTRMAAKGSNCFFLNNPKVSHIIRPHQLQLDWLLERAERSGMGECHRRICEYRRGNRCFQGLPLWMYRTAFTHWVKILLRGGKRNAPQLFPSLWWIHRFLGFRTQAKKEKCLK